ncbi:MAG: helix-turn-helix domain-containing protein [Paludibacter sp.]
MEKPISFENLPQAITLLIEKVESLELLLKSQQSSQVASDKPMSIIEAAKFVNLTVPTLYGFVSKRTIPFSKMGKRLYFSEMELTEWIQTGRKQTRSEISVNVNTVSLLTPRKSKR